MFGGTAPLPIRLGGSPAEGWTAAQHARVCADAVALARTAKLAVLTYNVSLGTVTIESFISTYAVGVAAAPSIISTSTGVSLITFPSSYEAPDGSYRPIHVNRAKAGAHGSTPIFAQSQPNGTVIQVRTRDENDNAVDARVTVVAWSTVPVGRIPRIGDYDGAHDKHDTKAERVPYAWILYQELGALLGSGFTQARTGIVHCHKMATARMFAAVMRASERQPLNAIPGTSDVMLGEWRSVLSVPLRGNENRQEVRQLCDVAFRQRTRGNDSASVDITVQEILGEAFVGVSRTYGTDLANPPSITRWPGVNPGPVSHDLGGGAWYSERASINIVIQKPATLDEDEFRFLVDVKLPKMLDEYLPAWASYTWSTSSGFLLDISQLDFDGF